MSLMGSLPSTAVVYRLGWWGLKTPNIDYRWDQYAALEAIAAAGDTVQVYNNLHGLGAPTLTVAKQLHFIGYGYFLQANAGYQAQQFADETIHFYLNPGASGSTVQGISGNVYIGNVNNINVQNCRLYSVQLNNSNNISNITIQGCWMDLNGQAGSITTTTNVPITNLKINNNYLNNTILLGGGTDGKIANNIFGVLSTGVNCNNNNVGSSNIEIKNNIIGNPMINYCFFAGTTGIIKNNLFSHNLAFCPAAVGNANVFSVSMNNTFSAWNNGYPIADSSLRLKLGSPAINAGVNNANGATDCGIYGGESNEIYRQSGVAALPAIYALSTPTNMPTGANMACTISTRSNNATNISRIEYFVDLDPGYGLGTMVPITPAINIAGLAFNLPLASLPEGPHMLFLRSKDANGNWSLINHLIFIKQYATPANSTPNIVRVEYYFDNDPGYGLANTLSIVPAANLPNLTIPVNPNLLSEGIHTLFVRSKDATNKWSLNNRWVFYRLNSVNVAAASNITRIEYYIDHDPGLGNATALSFAAAANLSNLTIPVNTNALHEGVHRLYVRSKDANNNWSLINHWVFYKYAAANVAASSNIIRVEYFLDKDPGFGNGSALNITPGVNLANLIIPINTNNLSEGVHRLYVRSKDANSKWSLNNTWVFYKYNSAPANTLPKITQLEYYIDTDPGYGEAIQVATTQDTAIASKLISINVSGLSTGQHTIWTRSKDSAGNWSLNNGKDFNLLAAQVSPSVVANSVNNKTACAGDALQVSIDTKGTFNVGNLFTVQLSNASGSFAVPINIGTLAATGNSVINVTLPPHLTTANRYRIRVNSSNPVTTGLAWADSLLLRDRPSTQTITGAASCNVGSSYSYSVPNIAGSSYSWIVPLATVTTSGNSASVLWNTAGLPNTVKVVQTSQYGCVGDTSSKAVNVYQVGIAGVASTNLFPCRSSTFNVTANVTGVFTAGNLFTAQLSNVAGSFASPVTIGTLTSNPSGTNQPLSIPVVLPYNTVLGAGYKVRVLSSTPSFTSAASVSSLSVTAPDLGANLVISKCASETYDLTSIFINGAYTFQYFTNAYVSVATPTAVNAGNYNILASNVNGCKDTCNITINNDNTPNLGPDQVKYYLANASYNLTTIFTNPLYTYEYRKSNWQIVNNPTAVLAGIYYIIANYNSCKDTAKITVKLGKPLAMFRMPQTDSMSESKMDIVLYPNPASSVLNLDFEINEPAVASIEIFDMAGKLVLAKKHKTEKGFQTISMDIGSLASGMYIVKYSDAYHQNLAARVLKE